MVVFEGLKLNPTAQTLKP